MNPLPKTCVTAALAVLLSFGAATAQAQAQRNTSEGSSLFSPADAGATKAPAGPPAARGGSQDAKGAAKADAKADAKGSAGSAKADSKAGPRAGDGKAGSNRTATRGAATARPSIAVSALTGRWQDTACVPLSGNGAARPLFVQRVYHFDEKSKAWTMTASLFGSDRCLADSRLLTYEGSGSYEITGRSRVGGNVYEATFTMDKWQATSTSREGTLAMFNARCGSGVFDEGRVVDLTRSGCSLVTLQPLTVAATGRELLRVTDDKIFLGANSTAPHQGSDRPTQLSTYGLSKL